MIENPRVSIITPCFNSEKFLEETILSVLRQSYKNIEYIIVDGGSSDGTISLIEKYSGALAYWVSEPDSGMYQAINKGLARASGGIVAYLNSDDLYYPDTISKVVANFINNPDADLIYGNLEFIDQNSSRLFIQRYPEFSWERFVNSKYATIGQPAAFWRMSLQRKVGGFDESLKMVADFDFFIRAGRLGKVLHISDVLAAFRFHPASMTSRQLKTSEEEVNQLHSRYFSDQNSFWRIFVRNFNGFRFKLLNWSALIVKVRLALGKI